MRRTFIGVEGDLDRFFIGKLLTKLDSPWSIVKEGARLGAWRAALVPDSFPQPRDISRLRVQIPVFYERADDIVAVYAAGADVDGVVRTTIARYGALHALGVAPDALALLFDRDVPAALDFDPIIARIRAAGLPCPDAPGIVEAHPRVGLYGLPTHDAEGAVEHLLLDCAMHAFGALCGHADGFATNAAPHLRGPREKAVVRSIAAIHRPDEALEMSLLKDDWITSATLALPRMKPLVDFLEALLG